MQEGQTMKITGIAGDLFYKGNSLFMIRNKETGVMEEKYIKRVGMIAAGSGLTPMFQLIQTVADQKDDTSLSLIYSCPGPVSIFFMFIFKYSLIFCLMRILLNMRKRANYFIFQ